MIVDMRLNIDLWMFVVPKRKALVLYNLYSDQIVGKNHFHQLIFSTYLRPSFEFGLED